MARSNPKNRISFRMWLWTLQMQWAVQMWVWATVTVRNAVVRLSRLSATEHSTVVVPIGKTDPGAGVQEAVIGPSTRSWAVVPHVATAPSAPVASTTTSAGA